jgi:hypothetical protein
VGGLLSVLLLPVLLLPVLLLPVLLLPVLLLPVLLLPVLLVPVHLQARSNMTPSVAASSPPLCSAWGGASRKRSGSPLGWEAERGAYGSSGRGEGDGPGAPKRPTLVFEKCGTCKCCLNPKLKKACVVVRMQRKEAGYPRS